MKTILVYGPHADEYSYARVNRGLAFALQRLLVSKGLSDQYEVKMSAIEGSVARLPNSADIKRYPELSAMAVKFDPEKEYDFLIYNNFPIDPNDLHGLSQLKAKVKISYIAWEEDRYPQRWVDEYNEQLDAVWAASLHTQRVLKNSGITVPTLVVSNAISEDLLGVIESQKASRSSLIKTRKSYIFYHNSTGLERKGSRELIEAYTSEFSGDDDVCLLIKSFPNANNQFPECLAELEARKAKGENLPEIEMIENHDLSSEEMVELYMSVSSYVSPSRAEGFNLPVLEAMQSKLPVITTAWSGQMDFCYDESAYLVDYSLVPARSHIDNPGAFWAEVSVKDLREKMRQAYSEYGTQGQAEKIELAYTIARQFSWDSSAETAWKYLAELENLGEVKGLNFGVISTFNSICGIAEYSSYLFSNSQGFFKKFEIFANSDAVGRKKLDASHVKRLWEYGEVDFKRLLAYLDSADTDKFDVIHIQHNLNFYTLDSLRLLIKELVSREIKVILTAHTVQLKDSELGYIKDALEITSQIHVLNHNDEKYLKDLGLNNVYFFPHGNIVSPNQSRERLQQKLGLKSPVIATHGFMIKHKGFLETLEAVALLKEEYPDITYLAVNALNPNDMTSQATYNEFHEKARQLGVNENVVHLSDFLERDQILAALSASDIVVFAYGPSSETASGAIRMALGTHKPLVVTTSSQLADLHDVGLLINNNQPQNIAGAIKTLLQNKSEYAAYRSKAVQYAQANSWDSLSLDYLGLISRIS